MAAALLVAAHGASGCGTSGGTDSLDDDGGGPSDAAGYAYDARADGAPSASASAMDAGRDTAPDATSAAHGHAAAALTSAGAAAKSAHYRAVWTLGESPGAAPVSQSSHFRARVGLVGATQAP